MNRNFIPSSYLVYCIVVGTSTLIPFSFLSQPQDQGFAILLGALYTILLFFLYRSILAYTRTNEDFIDVIKNYFGSTLSVIILNLYWIFLIFMLGKDLAIVWDTIYNLTLPKHSPAFIAGILVIHLFFICLQGGIGTILQISVFYATSCFIANIITFLLSVWFIDKNNFLPFFYNGVNQTFEEFFLISSYSSGEIFLLLFIPKICEEIKVKLRWFLVPLVFIVITNMVKYFVSVGLLGEYIKFIPLTTAGLATGVLTIGNAQLRIEPLVILAWFVTAIIKLSLQYYVVTKISARIIKKINYHGLLFPIGLLAWAISIISFDDPLQVIHFPKTYFIYGTIFQLIIPLLVFLGLIFRRKKNLSRVT